MANPHNPVTKESSTTTVLVVPLIDPNQNQNIILVKEDEITDTEEEEELEEKLEKLNNFLFLFGFHQSSLTGIFISWFSFVIVGVSAPLLILLLLPICPGCEKYQINKFELDILAFRSLLSAISLLCMSHNLKKRGIRKFLFVDRYHGHMGKFREQYIQMIQGFFRLLVMLMLPCFLLKTIREVIRVIYVGHDSWWISVAILFALLSSWTYSTIISLSASVLFYLICNLQDIHFAEYKKLLERETDVTALIDEHLRLRHHLSKISHRFRIFLLLEFLVVTSTQVLTLFRTTEYQGIITAINGGDFAVSSIVQIVGISICLHAAAKISHRAQRVASIASQCHALLTSNSPDPSCMRGSKSVGNFEALANPRRTMDPSCMRGSKSVGNFEALANPRRTIPAVFSESDLESLDSIGQPNYTQLASSYNNRQAFVTYLQSNRAGVTIYGWTVNRELISTVFLSELSLILFVLGKTVIFTSQPT
ncbi:hypothetical protein MKX03_017486 [Papaver bracteatum]|nr:hypothetical protein MKX03_017486 [Papaver bracteatum]